VGLEGAQRGRSVPTEEEATMASLTLTVNTDRDLTALLAPLDGLLSIDNYLTELLLRDAVRRLGEDLTGIGESGDELNCPDLLEVATRLEQVVDVLSALAPRSFAEVGGDDGELA
jgi:hypothetical protein